MRPHEEKGKCQTRKEWIYAVSFLSSALLIAGLLYTFRDRILAENWNEAPPKLPTDKETLELKKSELHGEVIALSLVNDLKPTDASAIRHLALEELSQSALFDLETSGVELSQLVERFMIGYERRKYDYFESYESYELGVQNGLDYAALRRGPLMPGELYSKLLRARAVLSKNFEVEDEATWILFCKHFSKGFKDGTEAWGAGRRQTQEEQAAMQFRLVE